MPLGLAADMNLLDELSSDWPLLVISSQSRWKKLVTSLTAGFVSVDVLSFLYHRRFRESGTFHIFFFGRLLHHQAPLRLVAFLEAFRRVNEARTPGAR